MDEMTKQKLTLSREISRIRRGCFDLGISERDLEEMAGFSRGLIYQWEKRMKNGHIPNVRNATLFKLKTTLNDLMKKQVPPEVPPEIDTPTTNGATPADGDSLAKRIAKFEKDCADLGLKPAELEAKAGMKPGWARQLKWRLRKDHVSVVRASTWRKLDLALQSMRKEGDEKVLAEMKAARAVPVEVKIDMPPPVMQCVYDDELTSQPTPEPAKPEVKVEVVRGTATVHNVMRRLIDERLAKMTFLELANVLVYLETK